MPQKRTIPRTCEQCGKVFLATGSQVKRGNARFCSHACHYKTRTTAPGWKGGRRITREGYRIVHSPNHPHATAVGCVAEHRLVMEQVLGRFLEAHEVVHHINGDRLDNRPENLQVMTAVEHGRLHARPPQPIAGWARKHGACTRCGTTAVKHKGHGLCRLCYNRTYSH